MKTILASVALAFLAVGCAADQGSETGQDQSELQTLDETPAPEAADMPSSETQPFTTVQTNCYLFCDSEYQDCIAAGMTRQECRVQQRFCVINYCHI